MTPKLGVDRGARLGVRIPNVLLERVKSAASERGVTLTEYVEIALRNELERETKPGIRDQDQSEPEAQS